MQGGGSAVKKWVLHEGYNFHWQVYCAGEKGAWVSIWPEDDHEACVNKKELQAMLQALEDEKAQEQAPT